MPPRHTVKQKKEEGERYRGERRREEQATQRVSRRKDNVNIKNLSKIRNSIIGLTHFTRILGETTAGKDGGRISA